jgi:hypothetical protein
MEHEYAKAHAVLVLLYTGVDLETQKDVPYAAIAIENKQGNQDKGFDLFMPRDRLIALCYSVLEVEMGLEDGQLTTVLQVARYPFSNPNLIEFLGRVMGVHPVEMDHIGRALDEYMQRYGAILKGRGGDNTDIFLEDYDEDEVPF